MAKLPFLIFCLTWSCGLCQNQFEGEWIISNKGDHLNNHLCIFKGAEVSLDEEDFPSWHPYSISRDTLIIFDEEDDFKLYFKIQALAKDSITFLPIRKREFEVKDGVSYEIHRGGGIYNPLKLIRRDLKHESIAFDSIVYSEKNPPYTLYSYYAPAVEIISKLKNDGRASYFRHETDTLKQSDLNNKRRIKFSDNEIHEANLTGSISDQLLLEFKNLLNKSNIKNIDINSDFPFHLHQMHSYPSTLEIYKDGKIHFRVHSTTYPLTLRPVVEFLEGLVNKIK